MVCGKRSPRREDGCLTSSTARDREGTNGHLLLHRVTGTSEGCPSGVGGSGKEGRGARPVEKGQGTSGRHGAVTCSQRLTATSLVVVSSSQSRM